MSNISHVFLNYMDTFLETIYHILLVSMMKTLVIDFTLIVISWVVLKIILIFEYLKINK